MLANALLFFLLSGILYYQYFFQGPTVPNLAKMATQQRTPAATSASLVAAPQANPLALRKSRELDWKYSLNCKNSNQEVTRMAGTSPMPSVILNIKKCEKEFPEQIVIENESNGFTASVFSLGNSYSKTDSIPLKKGKNIITIKYQLTKAKTDIVEKLSIEY